MSPAAATALLELLLVARVKKNDGMEIAVAGVKNIADFEAVLAADFTDAAQGGRKFRARDHAVLRVVGGRKASHGAEGVLAALPEKIAFARIFGDAHFARAMQPADFGDLDGLRFGRFLQSVDFDQ